MTDTINEQYEAVITDFTAYCHAYDLCQPEGVEVPFWFLAMLVAYYKEHTTSYAEYILA